MRPELPDCGHFNPCGRRLCDSHYQGGASRNGTDLRVLGQRNIWLLLTIRSNNCGPRAERMNRRVGNRRKTYSPLLHATFPS